QHAHWSGPPSALGGAGNQGRGVGPVIGVSGVGVGLTDGGAFQGDRPDEPPARDGGPPDPDQVVQQALHLLVASRGFTESTFAAAAVILEQVVAQRFDIVQGAHQADGELVAAGVDQPVVAAHAAGAAGLTGAHVVLGVVGGRGGGRRAAQPGGGSAVGVGAGE